MAEAIRGQGDAVTFNDVNLVRSAVAADEMAGGWGIQIGAFGSPTAARRAINSVTGRFPKILDGADPQLVGFKAADGMLYRARLVGLEEEAAQSVCAALVRSGGECMALAPDQM
jgi:D-alanyl-D-alanine carboxypeptidase